MSRRTEEAANRKGKSRPATAGETVRKSNDKHNPDNRQSEIGKRLDEALEETFPSSDAIAVTVTR